MSPTESPKIISFNEKHYAKVLKENEALKARFHEVLKVAHINQKTQDHFEILERKILKSRSLKDMARIIVREIQGRFQVDYVTICLALDPDDLLRKVQKRSRKSGNQPSYLRILEPAVLKEALPKRVSGPILKGKITHPESPFFSGESVAEIRSKAVIPLFLDRELIGTLNIGSRDPDRYTPEQGTDFLRRLGCKISLVMDNILTHQRLTELLVTDQLTGVSNRRYLDEALTKEVLRAKRYQTPLSCMLMDMDGFKAINDRFGHHMGDRALQHVAHLLQEHSRRNDVVARYGGDEFAVLLTHTSLAAATRVAEKYQRNLREHPFSSEGTALHLVLSIGVAALPEAAIEHPEDLIKEADRHLLLAKAKGGGEVVASPR